MNIQPYRRTSNYLPSWGLKFGIATEMICAIGGTISKLEFFDFINEEGDGRISIHMMMDDFTEFQTLCEKLTKLRELYQAEPSADLLAASFSEDESIEQWHSKFFQMDPESGKAGYRNYADRFLILQETKHRHSITFYDFEKREEVSPSGLWIEGKEPTIFVSVYSYSPGWMTSLEEK